MTRISLGIAGVLSVVAGVALLHRAWSRPQDGGAGTPEERALATAKRFLETAAVPIPTVGVTVKWRDRNRPLASVWEVFWNGMATVEVLPDTSTVVGFTNDWRILEQVRRWGRTGRTVFATEADARKHLERLVRALGVPEAARMEGCSYHVDDTPGKGDANKAGCASASFRMGAFGYEFVTPGGPGAWLDVDPQDGMLVRFHALYDHVAMPSSPPAPPRLTASDAETPATSAYLKNRRPLFRRASAPTRAKLAWIAPNESYGSRHRWVDAWPQRVRLAWVVYFGEDAVFVDPYDGSVLGGLETAGANPAMIAAPARRPPRD